MTDASQTSPGQDGSGEYSWPGANGSTAFDPYNVNLSAVLDQGLSRDVVCYLDAGTDEYDGSLGVRISAVFVILIVSSAVTYFPVMATRVKKLNIPIYVYLFARYFGAGVIIATAFVHLLDPAYSEIGPATCVGLTGGWSTYSWPPAIAMTSSLFVFLMDFYAERYVEKKYGLKHGHGNAQERNSTRTGSVDAAMLRYDIDRRRSTHQGLHSADQDPHLRQTLAEGNGSEENSKKMEDGKVEQMSLTESEQDELANRSFQQQIAAFLILEFGVLFHSVIIGLTLATSSEFAILYPVIVFHQSFEGLGIGARLSAIPFPKRLAWMPWVLCAGYGLTTPISIAVGLGIRTTYNSGSYTANVVSGILDSISAGILLYTGFVELLARDFLFNPDRTDDDKQLAFMICSVLFGAGIMALLGKWA